MNFDLDYVPSTVKDSFKKCLEALSPSEKEELKKCSDEKDISGYHHTFGADMRNNWSLWMTDTPLYNSFKEIGITHADDMSNIILISVHRMLCKKPIKLKELVSNCQKYWMEKIGKPMP